jgi:hypothetical protein
MKGEKHDGEKLRWGLLWSCAAQLRDVVRVLMHGANKYAPDNWQRVKDARRRYFEAAIRHLDAWREGERLDVGPKGSGLPHLAHAAASILILAWHDARGRK